MKEEKNLEMKEHMLDYVIALLEDANDFSWGAAKASHAVLLCRMEQGKVNDFSDIHKIDRIWRANAQKHVTSTASSSQNGFPKKFGGKNTRSMPCNYYNQDSCVHDKAHDTKGTIYKHICSSCFANGGKVSHTQKPNVGTKTKRLRQKTSNFGYRSRHLYPFFHSFAKKSSYQVFYERYATRQDWLTWFHESKGNTIDNRSYADVVRGRGIAATTPSSVGKFSQFHSTFQFSPNKNKKVDRTDILERHKHQSPVAHRNPSSPRSSVNTGMASLQKLDNQFQVDLHNRFAPLQDLFSELIDSNHDTIFNHNDVTHFTLSHTPRVSQNKPCKRDGSGHSSNDNLLVSTSPS